MTGIIDLSRRGFIIATGATGLTLGILAACAPAGKKDGAPEGPPPPEVNAWVHIGTDDVVTIRIARSEMGQGTLTGLAQLVAEELECDWTKVRTEYPTPGQNLARDRVWGDFLTGGSRGIRASHDYVREGGAAARMMLVQAAANRWGVPAEECTVANSVITHTASGKTLRFGEVVVDAAALTPPETVTLKDPSEWKLIGKSVQRLDTISKVTGEQLYATDLKFDGMLNAAVKAAPKRGGTVASFDASAVSGMPGVKKVVQVDETAVAVVADSWWQAKTALDALPIEWAPGEGSDYSSAAFEAELPEVDDVELPRIRRRVNGTAGGLAQAHRVLVHHRVALGEVGERVVDLWDLAPRNGPHRRCSKTLHRRMLPAFECHLANSQA